jgi:predicted Zn-dependent peptidase
LIYSNPKVPEVFAKLEIKLKNYQKYHNNQISELLIYVIMWYTNLNILTNLVTEDVMYLENIADSVRLCAEHTDKFKTCRINISMAMPLDGNVAARAILPFMLQRRSAKYPDFTTFNRVLDELYGASVSAGVAKRGEAQVLSFNLTAIDDRFALNNDKVSLECAELLTDLIFEPLTDGNSFPSDIIEQEKRLLIEVIENEKNDKRRYALMRCESVMFSNEAYGINRFGTAEQVKALTPDDVYRAWRDVLTESTVQITMVGSMDAKPVADMLRKKFASIERKPVEISTEFVTAIPKPQYVSESLPLKQGKLVMGFRTGMRSEDDNLVAMRVAVDIFGGGTYSKLFSVVREKMSLCYYCSASLLNAKGIVIVQRGIEDVNEEKSKKEIINQLSLVADGNFSNDDFSASIKSLSDAVIGNGDTPDGICGWYASQLLKSEFKSIEAFSEEIKKADKQQVIRAAKSIMLDTVFMLKSDGEGADDED